MLGASLTLTARPRTLLLDVDSLAEALRGDTVRQDVIIVPKHRQKQGPRVTHRPSDMLSPSRQQ